MSEIHAIAAQFKDTFRSGNKRLLLSLALVALGITLAIQQYRLMHVELPEARIDITQAWYNASDQARPPSEIEYGRLLSLGQTPEGRPLIDQQQSSSGWYTSLLQLKVPPNRLWGIYIPAVIENARVFINGEIVGNVAATADANKVHNRHVSAYLTIANGMLRPGSNEIQFQLRGSGNAGKHLHPFYLGPDSHLRPVYEKHRFFSGTLAKFSLGLLLFTALAFMLVWLFCRQEKIYGRFALLCLCWATLSGVMLLPGDLAGSAISSSQLYNSTLILFSCTSLLLCLRLQHRRRPLTEKLLFSLAFAFIVLPLLLSVLGWSLQSNLAAHMFSLMLMIYASFELAGSSDERLSLTACALLLPVTMIASLLLFEVHSLYGSAQQLLQPGLHLVAPLVVAIMSFRLIRDFVHSRHSLLQMNEQLELRVRQRTLELERNFQRLKELEKEQVLSDERERIMMEMHDGMGGHLVSMISMLELQEPATEKLRSSLQAALEDLRLVIDSLEPINSDITLALGIYRERLDRTLLESSVNLIWQVEDTPELTDMTPGKELQILRIVQEAVTNSLKYANATQLKISTGAREGRPFVAIEDNGGGMRNHNPAGRGLANMHQRAANLGAELAIRSTAEGVSVTLLLPDPPRDAYRELSTEIPPPESENFPVQPAA